MTLEALTLEARVIRICTGKYSDVLVPFLILMERELAANAAKGDRPGWLKMTDEQAMLEVFWHMAKLQRAVRDDNTTGVQEHAADVANMAMMLLDVCGGLWVPEERAAV